MSRKAQTKFNTELISNLSTDYSETLELLDCESKYFICGSIRNPYIIHTQQPYLEIFLDQKKDK